MFKIGEFSKLSQVSIKTLRYYDQRGVLQPATVDEHSGYRYYAAEQLLAIQRIISLKKQGFTLEEIKQLLAKNITTETVKASLTSKQFELQQTIAESQRQLQEIQSGLIRVRQQTSPTSSVTLRQVQAQRVAAIRTVIDQDDLCLLLNEIRQYVQQHGEDEHQPIYIQWYEYDQRDQDHVDVEVALPIQKNIPASQRVKIDHLPEFQQAASLIHQCNPYEANCSALATLTEWISAHGYRRKENQPIREIYLTPDRDVYGQLRVAELLIPIESI